MERGGSLSSADRAPTGNPSEATSDSRSEAEVVGMGVRKVVLAGKGRLSAAPAKGGVSRRKASTSFTTQHADGKPRPQGKGVAGLVGDPKAPDPVARGVCPPQQAAQHLSLPTPGVRPHVDKCEEHMEVPVVRPAT